jgi:DNA polymerase-3 subunit alpha
MVEPWSMKAEPYLGVIPGALKDLGTALRTKFNLDVLVKGQRSVRKARLEYEFATLKEKGFLTYIFILWDIVTWAKSQDIRIGPGRGSGAGSYLLYLLGITSIDPIEHGLLFERFINPDRADYPDIDTDFESDRRQDVINYARERWNAIPIATYSSYSHKSAVHDIARVLKIPKAIELVAADSAIESEAFDKFIEYHPDAQETYSTMIGQIRHRGKHAAGVVIGSKVIPIERVGDQLVAAWAEGMNTKDLSKVGLVKYDLLGVTALSQLRRMEELTGVPVPEERDDPAVFNLFCKGDVAGIFQWTGSEGIRNLTMKVAPRDLKDLIAINALYRPGTLDAGTAEKYPEYKKEPRLFHPRIDPFLQETYGIITYQEQVMQVFATVMGVSFGQADIARRLISKAYVGDKHWEDDIGKMRTGFMKEGQRNGFERSLLEQLWFEIYTHSRYSFNKSHSTAYTDTAYQMAWYKAHHRPAFTVAMLQYDGANAQTYIMDAVSNGLKISLPHVNYSGLSYTMYENTIYVPLSDISFLGQKAIEAIVGEREKNGDYLSYEDFSKRIAKRSCNNRARGFMERIGAFLGLPGDPGSAIEKYAELEVKGGYETQLQVLGYVVPSAGLVRMMETLRKKPCKEGEEWFAGFIQKIKDKKSEKGPYRVYYLSPHGSFWLRNPLKAGVGTFVTGLRGSYGTSSNVKAYKWKESKDD